MEDFLSILSELIRQEDLEEYEQTIRSLVRGSVVIDPLASSNDQFEIGASKIGGLPDLIPEMDWPQWEGKPLEFLLQLNLDEIRPFDFPLPTRGLLSFFMSTELTSPQPSGPGRVLYVEDVSLLQKRLSSPIHTYQTSKPEFVALPSLPYQYSTFKGSLWGLESSEIDDFSEAYGAVIYELEKRLGRMFYRHRLFGYPTPYQSDVEVEVSYASRGKKTSGFMTKMGIDDVEDARRWCPLLQLYGGKDSGLFDGDAAVYFMFQQQGAPVIDLSEVWTVLDFD